MAPRRQEHEREPTETTEPIAVTGDKAINPSKRIPKAESLLLFVYRNGSKGFGTKRERRQAERWTSRQAPPKGFSPPWSEEEIDVWVRGVSDTLAGLANRLSPDAWPKKRALQEEAIRFWCDLLAALDMVDHAAEWFENAVQPLDDDRTE